MQFFFGHFFSPEVAFWAKFLKQQQEGEGDNTNLIQESNCCMKYVIPDAF